MFTVGLLVLPTHFDGKKIEKQFALHLFTNANYLGKLIHVCFFNKTTR